MMQRAKKILSKSIAIEIVCLCGFKASTENESKFVDLHADEPVARAGQAVPGGIPECD